MIKMSDQGSNQEILSYLDEFVRLATAETVPQHMFPLYYLTKAYQSMFPNQDSLFSRLRERMELGMQRYGHGIRLDDDTRQWGTKENSWMEMCEEEILDGILYAVAHHLRGL
jgi:hypothetical protein